MAGNIPVKFLLRLSADERVTGSSRKISLRGTNVVFFTGLNGDLKNGEILIREIWIIYSTDHELFWQRVQLNEPWLYLVYCP